MLAGCYHLRGAKSGVGGLEPTLVGDSTGAPLLRARRFADTPFFQARQIHTRASFTGTPISEA